MLEGHGHGDGGAEGGVGRGHAPGVDKGPHSEDACFVPFGEYFKKLGQKPAPEPGHEDVVGAQLVPEGWGEEGGGNGA